MQQREQAELGEPAQQGAHHAGQQPQYGQLQGKQPQGFATRQPQAAQQRAGIEAAIGKTRGGQCHGHARQ